MSLTSSFIPHQTHVHTDNKIFSCSSYNSSSSLVKLFSNFPRESSWHDDRKDILPKFLLKPTESDEKFAESAKEINYWHRELWLIHHHGDTTRKVSSIFPELQLAVTNDFWLLDIMFSVAILKLCFISNENTLYNMQMIYMRFFMCQITNNPKLSIVLLIKHLKIKYFCLSNHTITTASKRESASTEFQMSVTGNSWDKTRLSSALSIDTKSWSCNDHPSNMYLIPFSN